MSSSKIIPGFGSSVRRIWGPAPPVIVPSPRRRGEFFIPVDADNLPIPTMVERFVEGMLRNPDLSVLTCFLKAFNDEEGVGADVAEFVYMPTGGPFVVSCFENVYGDTNAIFRTRHFREAGGFETDPDTFIEDWETFVKLVAAGQQLDVIPDVLFNYRIRGDNRSLTMSRDRTDMYPFVQRMIRRRFVPLQELQPLDSEMLWLGMAAFGNHKFHPAGTSSFQPASEGWQVPSLALRYRIADRVNSYLKWLAPIHRICRAAFVLALHASSRRPPAPPGAPSTAGNAGALPGAFDDLGFLGARSDVEAQPKRPEFAEPGLESPRPEVRLVRQRTSCSLLEKVGVLHGLLTQGVKASAGKIGSQRTTVSASVRSKRTSSSAQKADESRSGLRSRNWSSQRRASSWWPRR